MYRNRMLIVNICFFYVKLYEKKIRKFLMNRLFFVCGVCWFSILYFYLFIDIAWKCIYLFFSFCTFIFNVQINENYLSRIFHHSFVHLSLTRQSILTSILFRNGNDEYACVVCRVRRMTTWWNVERNKWVFTVLYHSPTLFLLPCSMFTNNWFSISAIPYMRACVRKCLR